MKQPEEFIYTAFVWCGHIATALMAIMLYLISDGNGWVMLIGLSLLGFIKVGGAATSDRRIFRKAKESPKDAH